LTEVNSGKSLNDLAADLHRLQERGVAGADVPMDDGDVRRLNVVATGHGDRGPALVSQDAAAWPALLQTDDFTAERVALQAALAAARGQATHGPVDRKTMTALLEAIGTADRRLTAVIRGQGKRADASATDAIEVSGFLSDLKDASSVLQRPDVSGYFDGTYVAKGKTAGELVRNIAAKGLRFAPATPRDQPAYQAVHRALAAADAKAHNATD
jgi:hypothetical protein